MADTSIPANPPLVKLCSKCKTEKTVEMFQRDRNRPDGRYPWCKQCRAENYAARSGRVNKSRREQYWDNIDKNRAYQKAYNEANKARRKEWRKKYYQENKEAKRDQAREWGKKNLEKKRAHCRDSYARHADRRKADNKKWYDNNRERLRAYRKEYYRKNKYKFIFANHKRISRTNGLPFDFTDEDMKFALTWWDNRCSICGFVLGFFAKLNFDHWIPVTDPACPGTVPWNMLPMCKSCNNSKKHKDAETWLSTELRKGAAERKSADITKFFAAARGGGGAISRQ
jgi:hypothetical protein